MKLLLTSILVLFILLPSCALAGDMQHRWKSPSFSGVGTSAHYLTIENQEFTRKAEIEAKRKSETEKESSSYSDSSPRKSKRSKKSAPGRKAIARKNITPNI